MHRHLTHRSVILACVLAAATLSAPAGGPGSTTAPDIGRSLTREEELHLLDARQAQLALDQARSAMEKAKVELDQVRTLFAEKLVTVEKLNEAVQKHDQAVLQHKQAEIELEKKRLEFLKDATLVTVVDAKKFRGEDGEIMAAVKLRNDSDLNKARIAMQGRQKLSDERLAALLKVDSVIVTLRGEAPVAAAPGTSPGRASSGKAIVGDPFQQIVPELKLGQEVVLEYRLLRRDVESVTVSLEFLGATKDYDVFLKKESQQDLPVITSGQYSQIGQLGSKITYDVDLERLAKAEQGFSLVVLNLPQEIKVAFLDPASGAMITEVRFTEELSKQRLQVELSIPEKLSPALVDQGIRFHFLATRRTALRSIFELKERHKPNPVPPEEIAKLKASSIELTVIPRGVGKLDFNVPNAFKEVRQGEPAVVKFNVLNSGTLALRQVTPKMDLPMEWEGRLEPTKIDLINGGEKAMFTAHVQPPPDVAVGDYTVKLQAEGHSGVEIIEAIDKDLTVRVVAESNITGTVILVTILIVLVVGIAVASIKISRR